MRRKGNRKKTAIVIASISLVVSVAILVLLLCLPLFGDNDIGDSVGENGTSESPIVIVIEDITFNVELKQEELLEPTYDITFKATHKPDVLYFIYDKSVYALNGECESNNNVYTYKGSVIFDRINEGESTVQLLGIYKKLDKILVISETEIVSEYDYFKIEYKTADGSKVVGLDCDALDNQYKISYDFEIVDDVYVYPTLTFRYFVGECPDRVEFTLDGQTYDIPLDEFIITKHDTYYELEINKIILPKEIRQGEYVAKILVYNDNYEKSRETKVSIQDDLSRIQCVDIDGGQFSCMNSDSWWSDFH